MTTPIHFEYTIHAPEGEGARISALLERLPLLADALAELALAQEETAVLLESLPENFISWRKHLYRRLADWSHEVTPGHFDEERAHQLAGIIDAEKNHNLAVTY